MADGFKIVPRIALYKCFADFAAAFQLNENDLLITNEFIYNPGLKNFKIPGRVIFQERFGAGEPSNVMMDSIFAEARKKEFTRVIAIGGGTVIDVAKCLSLGGNARTIDYFDGGIPVKRTKELVIIPTTCGTGSEVTNIAIMEIKEQNTKKGLAGNALYADYAVLIPELLESLPYQVFATSSMDALIHAMESFVAPGSTEFTEIFSTLAIEMIVSGYKEIARTGRDERYGLMKNFLLASNYAGIAFSNTGVGAVHALSYPLGGAYHVPHGEANQEVFITVFKAYKKIQPEGKIKLLERKLAELLNAPITEVWEHFDRLLEHILPRKLLREYGMKEAEIEIFTDSVLANQQRLLKNNYVPLSRRQIVDIYASLY